MKNHMIHTYDLFRNIKKNKSLTEKEKKIPYFYILLRISLSFLPKTCSFYCVKCWFKS